MPLVTPKSKPADDPAHQTIIDILYGDVEDHLVGEGIIITHHWNPEITWCVQHYYDRERLQEHLLNVHDQGSDFLYDYGVCDTPHQFMVRYLDQLKTFDRDICVFFVHVPKNPDIQQGWRWHKWGPYVGYGTPTCEYLADEELFDDGIYTYALYEVIEKASFIQNIET
jgi:hypothetical protein